MGAPGPSHLGTWESTKSSRHGTSAAFILVGLPAAQRGSKLSRALFCLPIRYTLVAEKHYGSMPFPARSGAL